MELRFSDVGEYIKELRNNPPNADKSVRSTIQYKSGSISMTTIISVISTYVRIIGTLQLVVKLEKMVGSYIGRDKEDRDKLFEKAQDIIKQIETAASSLPGGIECGAGVYE